MTLAAPVPHPPASLARVALLAGLGWLALNAAILGLSQGVLPFDRPNLAAMPMAMQIAMPSLGLIEQVALMGLVALLTRGRPLPAPRAILGSKMVARRETLLVLAYAMGAQAGGWALGPALGFRPFSFHLAGTLVGCSTLASPAEALVWAGYNFIAFAVLPYLWFRRTHSLTDLWLIFDRRGNDLLVLVTVLVVESAVQIAFLPGAFAPPVDVLVRAIPLAFVLFLFGTVLPTMILVYAILVPRYHRITGSTALTVILGGLTYAAMHLVEGWSSFATPSNALLSLLFVFLSYTGPGMFKTYVTLRTGNAWVHALAYHAVAPHALMDAPLVARVFGLM